MKTLERTPRVLVDIYGNLIDAMLCSYLRRKIMNLGIFLQFVVSVKAEDSSDILDQATELLQSSYKDPACVLAGVALEITLKELSSRNNIPFGKLDSMNIELCKKDVYNMGMQKKITAWAHWRNKAAHGEWDEYKDTDVSDMIRGITRFVADHL